MNLNQFRLYIGIIYDEVLRELPRYIGIRKSVVETLDQRVAHYINSECQLYSVARCNSLSEYNELLEALIWSEDGSEVSTRALRYRLAIKLKNRIHNLTQEDMASINRLAIVLKGFYPIRRAVESKLSARLLSQPEFQPVAMAR